MNKSLMLVREKLLLFIIKIDLYKLIRKLMLGCKVIKKKKVMNFCGFKMEMIKQK